MDIIKAELKRSSYTVYHFDGTKESAEQICKRLSLDYVNDFMDKDMYAITLPSGKRCYANNYIVVIDNLTFDLYSHSEFHEKFTIVDSLKYRNSSFMSGD
jgi:hypothetical protein